MKIDNFELVYPLFYFNESNDMFFHVQIVRRAKDHKPNIVKEKTIKSYFVRSREELRELKQEIVILCEMYGARAYINVAGKDFSELNKRMLLRLAENNVLGHTINPMRLLNSEAGLMSSRTIRWVLDIDNKDESYLHNVVNWLEAQGLTSRDWIEMPTVAGLHLILKKKINTQQIVNAFPDISVHKNSMGTLLYVQTFI